MRNIPPALKRAVAKLFKDADDAITRRDQGLRDLVDKHGIRPSDIRRITGKSDETIRRALMTPEQREALKARRRQPKTTLGEQP